MKRLGPLLMAVLVSACSPDSNKPQSLEDNKPVSEEKIVFQDSELSERLAQVDSYITQRQYAQASSKLDSAIEYLPEHMEYRFLQCLLKERAGGLTPQASQCYSTLVDMYSSQKPCEIDVNCVIADLMAQGEQATSRKEQFLDQSHSSLENEVYRYLLESFDRQHYLNSVLP